MCPEIFNIAAENLFLLCNLPKQRTLLFYVYASSQTTGQTTLTQSNQGNLGVSYPWLQIFIDDLEIWHEMLTEEDVQFLYQKGKL